MSWEKKRDTHQEPGRTCSRKVVPKAMLNVGDRSGTVLESARRRKEVFLSTDELAGTQDSVEQRSIRKLVKKKTNELYGFEGTRR